MFEGVSVDGGVSANRRSLREVGDALLGLLRRTLRPDRIVYAALVVAALVFAFRGAERHAQLNRNFKDKDQSAYLNLIQRTAESHSVEVDGARGPLFAVLLAHVHDPTLTRAQIFEAAKLANIKLTLGAWALLLFVLRRRLEPWSALAAWAALGFTVFMFYAPYVKAEGLFYSLATCAFVCLLDTLARPTLWRALLAGAVTGVAQLTKESMLPALGLFIAVQLLAVCAAAVRYFARPKRRSSRRRLLLQRLASVPLFLAAFLLVVSPHIRVNQRVFGHYFYNVNSYFYIWYDSWGEVTRGTARHGDRVGWPTLAEAKLPSAKKYFANHSQEQVLGRLERGASGLWSGLQHSHGVFPYLLLASLSGALALLSSRELRRKLVRRWQNVLFTLGYFGGYTLFCCWFFAIQSGIRFIVALLPPLVFLGAWLSDRSRILNWRRRVGFWALSAMGWLFVDLPGLLSTVVETARSAGW